MDRSLSSLLPPSSTFTLAYAIPLLLISLVVTFAGSFLTLSRTRSFTPTYDTIPGSYKKSKSFRVPIEGGIGGIALGYSFGLHLSTFFSLLIPAKTTMASLSSGSFLAVWLLSCLFTAGLAGRWRHAALTFAGISGGAVFALGFSVLVHPSLITRVVFVAVLSPITTVLCLLPLPAVQTAALRFASAATGSFGTVLSIALLGTIPGWANVWERLWEPVDPATNSVWTWGTSKEKGLSAAWLILVLLGIGTNIVLHRMFGECPDEKWDSYLANYSTNLPDRPGTYRPPTTLWTKLFGGKADKSSHLPPISSLDAQDIDSKYPMPMSPRLAKHPLDSYEFNLPKGFKKPTGRKSREVKFNPHGELSSDDEDDLQKFPPGPVRPWLQKKASRGSTTTLATLVDEEASEYKGMVKDKDMKTPRKVGFRDEQDYSDYEDDLSSISKRGFKPKQGDNWSPGFLKTQQRTMTHSSSNSGHGGSSVGSGSQRTAVEAPVGAVPATPSLIKALDRIALAQSDAFTPPTGLPRVSSDRGERDEEKAVVEREQAREQEMGEGDVGKDPHWTEFWKDVRRKERES